MSLDLKISSGPKTGRDDRLWSAVKLCESTRPATGSWRSMPSRNRWYNLFEFSLRASQSDWIAIDWFYNHESWLHSDFWRCIEARGWLNLKRRSLFHSIFQSKLTLIHECRCRKSCMETLFQQNDARNRVRRFLCTLVHPNSHICTYAHMRTLDSIIFD